MPLTWTVSHPTQLVVAVCKGHVSATDVLEYLDEIDRAGAMPYRKVFDLTGVAGVIPAEDVRLIGMRVVALSGAKPTGPLAIVVASDAIEALSKVFEVTADTKRPLQIFRDLHKARAWLDNTAPVLSLAPKQTTPS
jgi:hypothetical protein